MHCRSDGRSRPCQRADQRKKRKKVAAAHERLHQHRQHAEAAPHHFRKHAINVYGAGKHLADPSLSLEMAFAALDESRFACGVKPFGTAASYGRCGSTSSTTDCTAAAVRAVMNVEPMPIQSVTTAMVTRIHLSRADISGSVRFFSRVISPKNTR